VSEPLTVHTRDSFTALSNISIGVFALTRLQNLQESTNDIMTNMIDESQTIADIISTTDDLLQTGFAPEPIMGEEISGSGEEDGSGWFNEPSGTVYHREVVTTKYDVEAMEEEVSNMCNHTEVLSGKVEETKSHLAEKKESYDDLDEAVEEFSEEIDDLVNEFEQSASGDSLDYADKLMDAEMKLQKMIMRDFPSMKDVADAEMDEAQQVFFDVERNFTLIAADMKTDVTAATDRFETAQSKLHVLRSQMNAATANTNDATTLNAVNQQDLVKLQEDISKINTDKDAASEALEDAEQTLDSANTAVEKIKAGVDDMNALADVLVNTETPRLRDDIAATGDVSDLQASVDAAVAHAEALQQDTASLQSISTDLDTSPAGVSNSYKKTAMAMKEAEMASQDALVAATKAESSVGDRDWQGEANAARDRASDLLNQAGELESQDVADLRAESEKTGEALDTLDDSYNALLNRLDLLDAEIESVNQAIDDSDTANKAAAVEQDAADANALAAQAEEAAAAAEGSW